MRISVAGTLERDIYSLICSGEGIKARDIARKLGVEKSQVNRLLYASPFMHELCYLDDGYLWHGYIPQSRPHRGLGDFCGYYSLVGEFMELSEDEWLCRMQEGCRSIGRSLSDTRGLFHSFRDCRQVMRTLFSDLEEMGGIDTSGWETAFELRINRGRRIRIYADVLVVAPGYVFSLEFKMKDREEMGELEQAVKYAPYLEVIFGSEYEVIPALVLTRASDLYTYRELPGSSGQLPLCSGDMLFNLFDEYLGLLG